MGSCSQAPQSLTVLRAMQEYLDNWGTVGMDWDFWMNGVEQARQSFARLIHAEPDEVAVVSSLSDAVSMIASTLPYGERNHVVTTVSEFPTVGHVWLAHQQKGRITVSLVQSEDGFYGPDLLTPYMQPNTALVSVHHVSYYSAAKQDIAALARLAHAHGAWIFVDAYQSLGTLPVDVHREDIDMLASGCLKYLLGIPGVAFLYVRREIADRIQPAMTGWFGRVNPFHFDATHLDWAPGAARFNTGTPPVLASFAARGGIDLLLEVGIDRISERIRQLSAHAVQGALERGLPLASPTDVRRKGASTAIRVGDAHRLEEFLAARNIITSAREDVIRLAPHFFSTEEELDIALDHVAEWLQTCR
ncbi:MAG: aminotransferase class V-fold PLP-dependent enzyme [Alicyclobacillus sp.]|nr:aminotransferase class V-fold PLP-dependent enzyme [Alicyclobacillus sp.]